MMPRGVSLKCARTSVGDLLFRNPARALGVDHHRDRIGHADRVRELHERALGEARRDDVLGDVARHVARRAIDLRRILARERAAAVRRRAAVGVDDDLAAGDAGVAVRPADHEASRRVDVDLRVLVHQLRGDHAVDDLLGDVFLHRLLRDERAVLGGKDDRVDPHRRVAVVLDRDLRLAVGPQVVEHAVAPRAGQALGELVREHDRQRHQLFGFRAREAEHQALIAGAAGVHAHRDVGRLAVNRGQHRAGFGVEPVLAAGVADLVDRRADDVLVVDVARWS